MKAERRPCQGRRSGDDHSNGEGSTGADAILADETPAKLQVKRGPKPSEFRRMLREMFTEMSERSFATYYRAYTQAAEMHTAGGPNVLEYAVSQASRPNGSFNVSEFARIIEERVAWWIAEQDTGAWSA